MLASVLFIATIFSGLFVWLVSCIYRRHSNQWTSQGLQCMPSVPLFGSFWDIITKKISPVDFFVKCYNKSDEGILGFFVFHKAGLIIRDPELIKQIFIKDFCAFPNRYTASNGRDDPIGSNNLMFLKAPHWTEMKKQLSPAFTSTKLKSMFGPMNDVAADLSSYISEVISGTKANLAVFELRELFAKYTTDTIAIFVFGINANSLRNPNADLRKFGREIFRSSFYRMLEMTSFFFIPQIVGFFKFKVFHDDTASFIRNIAKEVMLERETSGKVLNDFMDILIKLKKAPYSGSGLKLEGDTLIAQTAIFFAAGFETSTTTLSFAMYELAINPEIQNKLREEIKQTLADNDGELSYDVLAGMTYLDMVVSETLRKYPPSTFLDRECKKPDGYRLPEPYQHIVIPPDTPVFVPSMAIHRDPKYYPNPECFDPERFTKEAIQARKPYTYIPMGVGPRACIGERIGLIQVKLGIFYTLKDHIVKVCSKTPIPIVYDTQTLLMAPKGGLHLTIEKYETKDL